MGRAPGISTGDRESHCDKGGSVTHEVEMLLNTQSGLLGISGLTNDMRVLQQELKEHDDRRVRLAIEISVIAQENILEHILRAWAGRCVVFTGNRRELGGYSCAHLHGLEWRG